MITIESGMNSNFTRSVRIEGPDGRWIEMKTDNSLGTLRHVEEFICLIVRREEEYHKEEQ